MNRADPKSGQRSLRSNPSGDAVDPSLRRAGRPWWGGRLFGHGGGGMTGWARPAGRARRWLIATALLAGVATATGVAWASTEPTVKPVVLPRDHGAHPGFNIEWWYTSGTVTGSNHHDYFWFATIWSSAGSAVAKVNVVDLRTDRVVLSHEYLSLTAFHAGQTEFAVDSFGLGWHPHGKLGRWSITVPVDANDKLTLNLRPVQPYVLNGRKGIIRQGSGGPSAYYSDPRLHARGSLEINGHTVTVSGQGWVDHQWGNFGNDAGALRWNWFACQFQNGSDLMLYQFLDPRDRPSGVQTGTLVAPSGAATHVTRFDAVPLKPRTKPAGAQSSYPLRWRLEVPSAGIDITIKARARNQFIVNQYVPSFWEGASSITHGAGGECTVESSRQAG